MGRGALAVHVPAGLWERRDVLDTLARRDLGQLFRAVQKETGATQTQLGIVVGLSQAQVSEVISGSRRVTSVEVLARIVRGLDMPDPARTVLFLGEHPRDLRLPESRQAPNLSDQRALRGKYLDVAAIFASRSTFASAHPAHDLFDAAADIRAVGLSLNLLCQQYADTGLHDLAARGARLQLLLLDPDGVAIKHREREEGHELGHLSNLNRLNLGVLRRVRDRLAPEHRAHLQVGVYDETIRFNIILVDERLCIVQPYLPHSRGVESPTLVIERHSDTPGLYEVFDRVFTHAWEGGRLL